MDVTRHEIRIYLWKYFCKIIAAPWERFWWSGFSFWQFFWYILTLNKKARYIVKTPNPTKKIKNAHLAYHNKVIIYFSISLQSPESSVVEQCCWSFVSLLERAREGPEMKKDQDRVNLIYLPCLQNLANITEPGPQNGVRENVVFALFPISFSYK